MGLIFGATLLRSSDQGCPMRPPYTRRNEDLLEALGLGYYEVERRKTFLNVLAFLFFTIGLIFAVVGLLTAAATGVFI